MKNLRVVLIGFLAVVVLLAFGKNTIARVSIEKGVKSITGLTLKMGGLRVGVLKPIVEVEKLRLYNPRGYKDKVMLDMPEIYVDYDLGAFLKGKVHLREVRINLQEFVVVKNEKGELNLDSLKVVKEGGKPGPTEKKKEPGKAPEFQIDKLSLKVGKVLYKDYSQGGEPSVQEFDVNLDQKYENITDPKALVSLIVVKALSKTTISRLANFGIDKLESTLTEQILSPQKLLGGAGAAGGIAAGSIKEVTKALEGSFKLPFGSQKEE